MKRIAQTEPRLPPFDDVWRDIRFAARSLRRTPGFTVIAALTLAIAIGAATALFSVLNGVLLRDLPVPDQDEVLVLQTEAPAGAYEHLPLWQGELARFREQSRAFESLGGVAFQGASGYALRDGDRTFTVAGTWVTGDLFGVLEIEPVHGRTLLPSDDVPGAAPVMVIGHGFWRRHFGGDPSAVGRSLEWNGRDVTIVGVLPEDFAYPAGAEFWIPVHLALPEEAPKSSSGYVLWDVVGRLRPGASVALGREDFQLFLEGIDAQRPVPFRGVNPIVTRLAEVITGEVRPVILTAAAAVALLLLIACVNVANLLLIRGSGRMQELSVRASLGAGRGRLVRQLLTESGLLTLLGAAIGVPLAFAATRVLTALAPPELPRREMIELDGRFLLFALAVSIIAGLISGILPAVVTSARELGSWLRGGDRSSSAGRGAQAVRHGLVIGQISLAILVVASAGLLVRSLVLLQSVDMGFDRESLLVFETSLPRGVFPQEGQPNVARQEMLARVAAIPSVMSAASVYSAPFSGEAGVTAMYTGEGQASEEQAANPLVNLEAVDPDYFRTLGLPLQGGRAFDERDREDSPRVAILSEATAQRTWPGEDPIGKRIKLGPIESEADWYTVVGVVGDTRYRDLISPQPTLYLPTAQFGAVPMGLLVRTRGDPTGLTSQIRSALREVHPAWQLVGGGSVRQLLEAPLARPRFSTMLLGTFAAITLLLATVGIYGAMAATVRLRTREIGIRMALGARVGAVRSLVLRQGMRLALWGSAIGMLGALLVTRSIRSMLFGISPTDPFTFVAVGALILCASALACYGPARRASRVDPVRALRAE